MDEMKLQALTTVISARMQLAARMGLQSYDGARNTNKALGYPESLTFRDYWARYTRQDIAKAIIDRPVGVTWRGDVLIVEANDADDTKLEKVWKDLNSKLGLKSIFVRVDKLTGLGEYGVILIGLSDVKVLGDFAQPAGTGKKILYLKPLSSESAKIANYVSNPTDERYGLPEFYDISVQDVEEGKTSQLRVHHSRVVHIVDDVLENEVKGSPRLEVVFNRLLDIEKIVGGDAEMFWRGARPGYSGTTAEGYQVTEDTMKDLQDQIDEYEHNLRRFLINEGIKLESLAQQIADPKNHVDVQIQMLSAVTGIPKRILTGSERGELASSQDKEEWLEYVQSRRDEYAEVRIIRPFIEKLIALKVFPPAGKDGYTIGWSDLFSISEQDKAEIGKTRAMALKEYFSQPMAADAIPLEVFLELFLGLTPEQVEWIVKMRQEMVLREPDITEDEEGLLAEEMIPEDEDEEETETEEDEE